MSHEPSVSREAQGKFFQNFVANGREAITAMEASLVPSSLQKQVQVVLLW